MKRRAGDPRARVRRAAVMMILVVLGAIVAVAPPASAAGPAGTVTNLGGDGINGPEGIVTGADGALWFTNPGNNTIGRVDPGGSVSNYTDASIQVPRSITAGPDGALWFTNGGNDTIGRITIGGAVSAFGGAAIRGPQDITAGPDGALWFTNGGNDTIGRITTGGTVSAFAGAAISYPWGITAGSDGALWFTNQGGDTIGRITTAGVVTAHADPTISSPLHIAAGSDGALWFTNGGTATIGRITTVGAVANFGDPGLRSLSGITAGPAGALWFTDLDSSSIGRITVAGAITMFTDPAIDAPQGIAAGPDGALWFTNGNGNTIGRSTTTGVVSTFGHGLASPADVVEGPDGALWFVNSVGNSVGRITTAGAVTNITGPGIDWPAAIAVGPDGALWFTNQGGNSIGRVTTGGAVSTFTDPAISTPDAITSGPDGALWFTNLETSAIGRITTGGVVTSFGDSSIVSPRGIAAGSDGALWITNQGNNWVSRMTTAGAVTNFASPSIDGPQGITAGPDGALWFTNQTGDTIGRITTGGAVSSFGDASIDGPQWISPGPDGALWFTNSDVNTIGRITTAGAVSSTGDPSIASPMGIGSGPDGAIWFTNAASNSIGRLELVGPPGAPGAVVAAGGDTTATVSWQAPALTGGAAITGYTVTATPGGATCAWTSGPLSCTVPGLTNTVPYSFRVTATNTNGTGPASVASAPVTPGQLPGAPTTVAAVAGVGQLQVTWSAPASSGTAPITGYTASASPGSATCSWSAGPLACAITGLDPGTAYTVTVAASSEVGVGPSSSPSTPVTTPALPGPPSAVTATAGPSSVVVTWNAPAADGGSLITGYTATASPGGATCAWSTGPRTCTILGLAVGQPYTVKVSATNAVGTGPASASSNTATPVAGLPTEPRTQTVSVDVLHLGANWFAPFSDGGSPILGYHIEITGDAAPIVADVGPSVGTFATAVTSPGAHSVSVAAVTSAGTGPADVKAVTVPAAITAPRNVQVLPGDTRAYVTFDPPADTGGLSVQTCIAVASPGGVSGSAPSTLPITVNGLANGVSVTLSVRCYATSHGGYPSTSAWVVTGDAATAGPVVPGVPPAPGLVLAVAGNHQATLSWAAVSGPDSTGVVVTPTIGGVPQTPIVLTGAGPWTGATVTGLASNTTYTFTVAVTNPAGTGPASAPSNAVVPWSGSSFHPVTPTRLLDSRAATGGWHAKLTSGSPRELDVAGVSPVPAGAAAVEVNVTVTNADAGSFVTVWPSGGAAPTSSTINFPAGATMANFATVKIGTGGRLSFSNAVGAVDVVVDVVGYYDGGAGDLYNPIAPQRLLDSRGPAGGWGSPLVAGSPRPLTVRGPGLLPATATAVVANVTVTNSTTGSFLTAYPSGTQPPNASVVNFGAFQTIPNLTTLQIGADGKVVFANAQGAVDVVVDVVGYFDSASGARFHTVDPTRVLDSRNGTGLNGPWHTGTVRQLPLAGVGPIGADAVAVSLNTTVTNGTAGSFLTVWPAGLAAPSASSLNFGANQTIANRSVTGLGTGGAIAIANLQGDVDVIADAVGWFAPT